MASRKNRFIIITIILSITLFTIFPSPNVNIWLKVFLLLGYGGAFLNFLVVKNNNWKMPIITFNSKDKEIINSKCDQEHFFQLKENLKNKKVKLYLLADIIPLKFGKYIFFFSVGDLLMILGFLLISSSPIYITL